MSHARPINELNFSYIARAFKCKRAYSVLCLFLFEFTGSKTNYNTSPSHWVAAKNPPNTALQVGKQAGEFRDSRCYPQ